MIMIFFNYPNRQNNSKYKTYETCQNRRTEKRCQNFSKISVLEFANQICMRAKQFDKEISGEGVQQVGDDGRSKRNIYCYKYLFHICIKI